jgi:tRNA threonylcarbamoyladenosine biosynthesis protein TsaB
MITLALDTSMSRGSVALLRDDKPVGEVTFERGELFSALHTLTAARPTDSSFDLIAVGVGPGSFTGIRAGIAAAKGLALPGALPIKAVSSFDALALTALPALPRDCAALCVLGDARRDEVYLAWYDRSGQRTGDIQIGPLEQIADNLHSPAWFVSAEIERYRAAIIELCGGFATVCERPVFPSAAALGWLAVQRYRADGRQGDRDLAPIYLRKAEYRTS